MDLAVSSTDESGKTGLAKTLANPVNFILMLLVVFLTAHTIYQVKRKGKTVGGALKDDAKLLATPTAVVAILGFVTGLMEFILVQNINEHGFGQGVKTGKIFKLPPKKELGHTAVTLLIVSVITGFLTDLALKALPVESKENLHARLMG